MSIYSVQLYLGPVPSSWTMLYSAPSSGTIVIRDIELVNGGTSTSLIQLSVQRASGSPSGFLVSNAATPVSGHIQWTGRAVLLPGDQIWGNGGVSGVSGIISGYNLT